LTTAGVNLSLVVVAASKEIMQVVPKGDFRLSGTEISPWDDEMCVVVRLRIPAAGGAGRVFPHGLLLD
jgi:hypothetical protein